MNAIRTVNCTVSMLIASSQTTGLRLLRHRSRFQWLNDKLLAKTNLMGGYLNEEVSPSTKLAKQVGTSNLELLS